MSTAGQAGRGMESWFGRAGPGPEPGNFRDTLGEGEKRGRGGSLEKTGSGRCRSRQAGVPRAICFLGEERLSRGGGQDFGGASLDLHLQEGWMEFQ